MLKGADFADSKSVFNCEFSPISPHAVLALCVQKMFKQFTKELPVFNRRQQNFSFQYF